MHFFVNFTRTFAAILEWEIFQISFKTSKSNPNLNQEFITASEPYLTAILIALIPLGLILDIAVWCRPNLARFIFYFEAIYLATVILCPLDFGALQNFGMYLFIYS